MNRPATDALCEVADQALAHMDPNRADVAYSAS